MRDFGWAFDWDNPPIIPYPCFRTVSVTLVVAYGAYSPALGVPTEFTMFDRLRIIYASKAVEADINHGQPLKAPPYQDLAQSTAVIELNGVDHALPRLIEGLAGLVCTRREKNTVVYLLDDLGFGGLWSADVRAGRIGPKIHEDTTRLDGSPLATGQMNRLALRSRRDFLAEVDGVLEPDMIDIYRRLEDTPREEKMNQSADEARRLTAYLFGDWTVVRAP